MIQAVALLTGRDFLASAVAERLALRGFEVTRREPYGQRGVNFDHRDLQNAAVLVLAGDDDAGNVDAALTVRRAFPALPIVIRVFDATLAAYLEGTLANITILSMSTVAAPVFADAVLRAMEQEAAQAVLPALDGYAVRLIKPARRRQIRPDRVLVTVLVALALFLTLATVYFANALQLSVLDALYFVCTTVTTVGYGDISLRTAPANAKVAGMILMFGGAAFVAALFAFFTDWLIARRVEVIQGRVQVRRRGHVVIAGGGNLGFRAARILVARGCRVVIVEKNAQNRHIPELRASGSQVLLGDATADDILDLAAVHKAGAILAVTESEATNLHIALLARARRSTLPVVMRTSSPELSAHVSERRHALAISPIALAAETFCQAAMAAVKGVPESPRGETLPDSESFRP